ncbi:MAG: hypothetical protein HRT35_29155 [Algicola sp.]|nr:hypothetical protein [Algicola sp.]
MSPTGDRRQKGDNFTLQPFIRNFKQFTNRARNPFQVDQDYMGADHMGLPQALGGLPRQAPLSLSQVLQSISPDFSSFYPVDDFLCESLFFNLYLYV